MAVTFFWRCETETLDATHDFSAGDTTAAANATPSISATAALVGSNGALFDSVGDQYRFLPTSLISPTVGSAALLFHFPTALAANIHGFFFSRGIASSNDNLRIEITATDELALVIRNATAGSVSLPTTGVNLQTATTYGVVIRWDQPNNKRRIEVYDATGTLIQAVEDLVTAFTAPAALDETVRFGDFGGMLGTCYVDNVFLADTYDEPLEDNLFITSWTEYGGVADPEGSLIGGKLLRGGLLLHGVLGR